MMKDALDAHNRDNVARIKRFATMLPGLNELDLPATRSITAGWKWVVFWTVVVCRKYSYYYNIA